jgi:hypothetical protein
MPLWCTPTPRLTNSATLCTCADEYDDIYHDNEYDDDDDEGSHALHM